MKTFVPVILIALAAAFSVPRTLAQSCTTATCTAASPSEADFVAALPSSSNTNATVVVNIPSGTSAWTTGFSYTVPSTVTSLTIQGATVVTCAGTAGTSSYACTSADNTVIQDSINSATPLVTITTGANSSFFRITGITWEGGTQHKRSITERLRFAGTPRIFASTTITLTASPSRMISQPVGYDGRDRPKESRTITSWTFHHVMVQAAMALRPMDFKPITRSGTVSATVTAPGQMPLRGARLRQFT